MGLPYDGRDDKFVQINQNQTPMETTDLRQRRRNTNDDERTPNQIAHQKFLDKKEKQKAQELDQKQAEPAPDEVGSSISSKPRSNPSERLWDEEEATEQESDNQKKTKKIRPNRNHIPDQPHQKEPSYSVGSSYHFS